MTESELSKEIKKAFPNVWIREEKGVLITGEGAEMDGFSVFDYYPEIYMERLYVRGVLKAFLEFLYERGFHPEPIDCGTLGIYKN